MNATISKIVDVTSDNVEDVGLFCIKNKQAAGYEQKLSWFQKQYINGLRLKIAFDEQENQLAFIEYIPAEYSWRPIEAPDYFFVHCIVVYAKGARQKGVGSGLLIACEDDAIANGRKGICVMTSKESWMADHTLFEKNGYRLAESRGRFDLMYKPIHNGTTKPHLLDWTKEHQAYEGWHLVYADQCPWHEKSVNDLQAEAERQGIDLIVRRFADPSEARHGPTGYGTFGLLHDGKLLADHYISRTRFKNILKKELA